MIEGIRLGTTYAGIRKKKIDDLTLFEISEGSRVAAVFTKNAFCAAPVTLAKNALAKTQPRYLLINAGNANAGTGQLGIQNAQRTCEIVADLAGCHSDQVLPFSTGVIGEQLKVACFESGIPHAFQNLQSDWQVAANAIMTTDTRPKMCSREITINGQAVAIRGIAKGAGMIRPDMATMLAFIATDAEIDAEQLDAALITSTNKSFNRISIDGDTSTNDACVLIATGKSNVKVDPAESEVFQTALDEVCTELAQAIVKDGEGATKFISIKISGATSQQEALDVAYTIAHSPLVKTAFFASDPNWGRILAAIGRAGVANLDISAISIQLDQLRLITKGEPDPAYTEAQGAEVMAQSEITINVDLERGDFSETIWTCDFSYDYVRINAEYRT